MCVASPGKILTSEKKNQADRIFIQFVLESFQTDARNIFTNPTLFLIYLPKTQEHCLAPSLDEIDNKNFPQ